MHDLIIIGGSAAGASATVYAKRRGLNTLVIAGDLGGEVATSGEIENWLGITHTTGVDLSSQFAAHLRAYQPDILEGYKVTKLEKKGEGHFVATTDDGKEHEGKAVIIATGVHPRELGVPGEKEYRLKGVSYCTVCDGPVFKGKPTAVIGGGNSALEAALMLSDLCPSVTVINKNAAFKGEAVLMENLKKKSNVTIVYDAATTVITGDGKFADGLKYKDKQGAEHEVKVAGMFVHIGQIPNSQIAPAEVGKNAFGEIEVGLDCATSVAGIYAAGDVTNVPHKQIVIAAGMGSAAALSAVQYINKL
jgi:alkyl hydroperoxide reductase subunit AhpF